MTARLLRCPECHSADELWVGASFTRESNADTNVTTDDDVDCGCGWTGTTDQLITKPAVLGGEAS